MSNSKKKMDVVVGETAWGKKWAKVTLRNSKTFVPSFEDLHRIIQAISYCEDEKYPNGAGRGMVAAFLIDAVYEEDWAELARKYAIPIRCGNIVIESNDGKV